MLQVDLRYLKGVYSKTLGEAYKLYLYITTHKIERCNYKHLCIRNFYLAVTFMKYG